jgi:hypothetical protein
MAFIDLDAAIHKIRDMRPKMNKHITGRSVPANATP